MVFKKKLFSYRPDRHKKTIETFRTTREITIEKSDPQTIERTVRQHLADKISGTMVGLWLLVPEHLRLGTWDLVCQWTGTHDEVEPRLAMQLIHESALCLTGVRASRSLNQKGFETVNGLPFIASDQAIHTLLDAHTVREAEMLQIELGLLRRARGHFQGKLLAIDPHRIQSYSKRQMRRHMKSSETKSVKVAQTFFCLDADTEQPVCFTSASAAMKTSKATPPLMTLTAAILNSQNKETLVVADTQHCTVDLLDFAAQSPFDLLTPIPRNSTKKELFEGKSADDFIPRWAGFATKKVSYDMRGSKTGPHYAFVQRLGETSENYHYKAFISTRDREEVDDLTLHFPKRWHIEEFFNANQALGWQRAGTMNQNIRYGHMTMALIAQAVLHQFRKRLGKPYNGWNAEHIAQSVFQGIDGDIRVSDDTIMVTLYNAPNVEKLQKQYGNLPQKLEAEGTDPRIPWLFNYKLDFLFK